MLLFRFFVLKYSHIYAKVMIKMSFIITLHVREGIVMASDSRLTFTQTRRQKEGNQVVQMGVGFSDSNYKTFLTPQQIGISMAGQASIQGAPLSGYIESFIHDQLGDKEVSLAQAAEQLLDYFLGFEKPPETMFHVAGYEDVGHTPQQQIWQVNVAQDKVQQVNRKDQPGLLWGGEGDILARIIKPVAIRDARDESKYNPLPYHRIPFEYFTLQDAIDFAIYAMRTTIDSIRFLPRPKTVGGPIDVLVIKPDQAFWIQRKKLHGERESSSN